MTKSMKNPTQLIEWLALKDYQTQIAKEHMRDWFDRDKHRFQQFSLEVDDILLDYSRNKIDRKTIDLLMRLAYAIDLPGKINGLFAGQAINTSENRPALHTALRDFTDNSRVLNGKNISTEIKHMRDKMAVFTQQVHDQTWRGATGKPITDIINIGIGGSHTGPLFTTYALNDFAISSLRFHFIANIDKAHLNDVLEKIDPETSLFIISSKSFATLETLTNAQAIREWMQMRLGKNIYQHFVAVTAADAKAIAFGIPEKQIFTFWDWVGGRYSIWSAIGLPLMLKIGPAHFDAFLAGAHAMDQHFQQAPFAENMPVLMALLGIWYTNFFSATAQAIVPYSHRLRYLIPYLQQAEMESNGKSHRLNGEAIDYATSPVIFGEEGCNGQHTFHQLLHQGSQCIPVDFILTAQSNIADDQHHPILIASCISQANALMRGKTEIEALAELRDVATSQDDVNLARHRILPGNRPSNIILLKQITPTNIGALLALYEHKIFVQGAIWGINSFDQWGVELGKQLLPDILQQIQIEQARPAHDILQHLRKVKTEA